jgi:heme exporter protein A
VTLAGPSSAAPTLRVEARGVSKAYGRHLALARTNLSLAPGEAVALLGANGAGKSTLLALLATLSPPSTGELRFDGELPSARARASIGVIAHESLCYADLTARENLAFFARLYAVDDGRARAEALLARVGLEGAADRPARTYSRGMLQRLAVARALLHHPRLLLLDEPFTGLDRDGAHTLAAILVEERARGATLLVVSHDFEPLPRLASRALVLRRGRLAFDGPAPDDAAGFRALYAAWGAPPTVASSEPAPESVHA